jgi:hypothetical protein
LGVSIQEIISMIFLSFWWWWVEFLFSSIGGGGSEISGVPPLPGIFKWNSPESFLLFFPGTFCKIIKVIDKKQTNKQQKQTKKSPFVNLQLYNFLGNLDNLLPTSEKLNQNHLMNFSIILEQSFRYKLEAPWSL